MIEINKDGIKEYKGEYGDTLIYFEDWLIEVSKDACCQASLTDRLIAIDATEDEIIDYFEDLYGEFYDYCDKYEYRGEIV